MSEESLKSRTVALIRQGRALERETIANLTPAQRDTAGTLEKWGAKEKLVHINAWKAVCAENFADARAGRAPDLRNDYLAFNNATFEAFRQKSWEEVERYCDEATDAVIAEVEALTEEELARPGLYEWLGQRNAAEYAASICIWHGLMHMTESYIERGEGTPALEMLDRIMPATLDVIQGERATGTAKYNQACIYAQVGMVNDALRLLGESFLVRPDLREYSQQDSDLAALWESDTFRALVSEPALTGS